MQLVSPDNPHIIIFKHEQEWTISMDTLIFVKLMIENKNADSTKLSLELNMYEKCIKSYYLPIKSQ